MIEVEIILPEWAAEAIERSTIDDLEQFLRRVAEPGFHDRVRERPHDELAAIVIIVAELAWDQDHSETSLA